MGAKLAALQAKKAEEGDNDDDNGTIAEMQAKMAAKQAKMAIKMAAK